MNHEETTNNEKKAGDLKMRTPRGRFVRGVSGNPSGRPVGSRNRATVCRDILDANAEDFVMQMVNSAMLGNTVAMKLVMDRLVPVCKELPMDVKLRSVKNTEDLLENYKQIVTAIVEGRMTAAQGQALTDILTKQAAALGILEQARRASETLPSFLGDLHDPDALHEADTDHRDEAA